MLALQLAYLDRQPGCQLLGIVDRALPKHQLTPDLASMKLHRPARPLIQPKFGGRHSYLSRYEGDHLVRQFRSATRKPAMPAVELQQQREAQPGRTTLPGNQRLLIRQQRPALNQLIDLNRLHRRHTSRAHRASEPGSIAAGDSVLPTPLVD